MVMDESIGFEMEGSRGGERSFVLRAARTTTLLEETMRLEEVDLEIFRGPGAGLRIESREGFYLAGSEEVEFRGDVRVWRGEERILRSEVLEYRQQPERLESPVPVEFAAEQISGRGAGLRFFPGQDRLEIDGPVFFRYLDPSLRGEPVHGRCWRLTYQMAERNAYLYEDASLRQADTILRGWNLSLLQSSGAGAPPRLSARSAVHFRQPAQGRRGAAEVWSDQLHAVMDPGAGDEVRLDQIDLAGGFVGTDGVRQARGDVGVYRFETGRGLLETRVGQGARAELKIPGRRVRAERIHIFDNGGRLEAIGDVETVLQGAERPVADMPFPFDPGEPITVYSGRLETNDSGDRAVFSDGVVAWQGEHQIQAGRIEVEGERMISRGDVLTRFPIETGEPSGEEEGDGGFVTVRSDRMTYSPAERQARYEGHARMDRGTASTNSGLIIAELGEAGEGIERLILEEQVRLRLDTRTGTADRGVYIPHKDLLILTRDEGFVELSDPAEGRTLRSRQLTLDLSDDSMMAETGKKGRLWMTLTPGRGETDSIDADIGD
jgi:lipopolysaccharide export system protein LptA